MTAIRTAVRNKIVELYNILKDAIPFVAYLIGYLIWFYIIEHADRLNYTVIHVAADDVIPFVPAFIIPYEIWFFFVGAMMVYFYFRDRRVYHESAAALAIGMTLFLVVSTVWPNIQYLRPRDLADTGLFTHLVLGIYSTDTPTNICPSIHVFNTVVLMGAIRHSRGPLMQRRAVAIPLHLLGISIVLSTMFVKQHSMFDVICALLLYVPVRYLCFTRGFTFISLPVREERSLLARSKS